MKFLLPTLLLLLAVPARAADLTVFAAASLTDALEEIGTAYERAGGGKVALNLGASSTLARQIQEGAPADLFLSADEAKMDALEKRGLILAGTRRSVLSNTLVIVVPADTPSKIASPKDLAGVRTLALAEPQSVPAGLYAREYLTRLGLWDKVAGKVVPTENVRAALAAVEAGNADAAIVYKTDAGISKRVKVACEVPLAEGPKISYPFAVVTESKQKAAAKRFLAYLESEPALAVFRKYGFLVRK
ncbi:MAG TPA: molybdate ABC transporter substrate-binding protein [Thermoanaerobaculia bacterium]|nr:molybdate ABC transporter substrate-binding protein [Thermoanaerobaculia bacterium]